MLKAALNHERLDQVLNILARPDTDLDDVRMGHGTGTGLPFLEAIGCRDHIFLDHLLASDVAQAIIQLHNSHVSSGHMPLTMTYLDGHYNAVTVMLKHGVRSRGSSEDRILWFLCYRLGELDTNSATFREVLTAAEVALKTGTGANVAGTAGSYPLDGLIQNPVHFDHWGPLIAGDFTRYLDFMRRLCTATDPVNLVTAFRRLINQLDTILTHSYNTPCLIYSRSLLMLPLTLWRHKMRIFLDAGVCLDGIQEGTSLNPFQLLVSCLVRAHRVISDLLTDGKELTFYQDCLQLVFTVYTWLVPYSITSRHYVASPSRDVPPEVIEYTIATLMEVMFSAPDLYVPFLESYLEHLNPKERADCLGVLEKKIGDVKRYNSRNVALLGFVCREPGVIALDTILFRLRSPSALTYLARCRVLRTFSGENISSQ
ncbi:hypothetical protein LSH36_471g06016 [Paralvinella palmiformis]|uniref:Uncharacterized protein n=1 Tax=Paralvinella palmiformis TaxID=53620 RepID=A0AAD9JB55_9ANNE|nr:hypothetical protein LSH36_471g06016 [Paralvinella palmiformis]